MRSILHSGGRANNLAIKGTAYRYRRQGKHLITTAIEHPSILNSLYRLQKEGFTVDYLLVNDQGYISLERLGQLIKTDTILVSINVNNEIGTIQPVREIKQLIKQHPAPYSMSTEYNHFASSPLALPAGRWICSPAALIRSMVPRE